MNPGSGLIPAPEQVVFLMEEKNERRNNPVHTTYGSLHGSTVDVEKVAEGCHGHARQCPSVPRPFPYTQLTLLFAATVGLLLVVFVFTEDYYPWEDLFDRGAAHVINNFAVAFFFFFSSGTPIHHPHMPWGRCVCNHHYLPSTYANHYSIHPSP
jgi:hypothetical protein